MPFIFMQNQTTLMVGENHFIFQVKIGTKNRKFI